MRTSWSRLPILAAALGVLLVLAAPAANAITWYSRSSPLNAYEGGVVQAAAYGNFYNYNGSYARSQSYHRDVRAGGNAAYVDTDWYFYEHGATCPQGGSCFLNFGGSESVRTTSSAWKNSYVQKGLRGTADRARGQIHVCEQQAFSGDPCSAWVIRTFNY